MLFNVDVWVQLVDLCHVNVLSTPLVEIPIALGFHTKPRDPLPRTVYATHYILVPQTLVNQQMEDSEEFSSNTKPFFQTSLH